ncbi:ORF28 [Ranid herpesvirus 1]|uniref:ORF28 n=1 Tax=Ranid herpesvirus 1 TaxID=85655 RepID=Q14VT0_9VIRU|nr:ORF28 [Ranid herpesvirus 1]ABG25814.1 ORF28 [Ranid herpesvirus 1]
MFSSWSMLSGVLLCSSSLLSMIPPSSNIAMCSKGTFLNKHDAKCYNCPPGTWRADEHHSFYTCSLCRGCGNGFVVERVCTGYADTFCGCPKPYQERDGFCLLYAKKDILI